MEYITGDTLEAYITPAVPAKNADMMKTNTSSTITSLYAYGDYSHAQQSVTLSQIASYGVYGSGGIVLPSAVQSKFDAINPATVYWTGTW